jgi:hypothetical protein
LILRPDLGGLEPQPINIKTRQSLKSLGCQRDS